MANSNHPFAQPADLISSAQKDASYHAALEKSINNIARKFAGVRQVQRYHGEVRVLSMLAYLSCTTILGNRTLGEEYCEILPVENRVKRFPSLGRRFGHVVSSCILPYLLTARLPGAARQIEPRNGVGFWPWNKSLLAPILVSCETVLSCIRSIANLTPSYALYLAIFYLRGRYYHFSKQVFQIRYIYSKKSSAREEHGTYEILGLLLLLQIICQVFLHIRSSRREEDAQKEANGALITTTPSLQAKESPPPEPSKMSLENVKPGYEMGDSPQFAWVQGSNRRKCTLCLEALKDPSVTTCGHVFCWSCIAAWIQEKPACPLCRQGAAIQHVLPMRS